MSKPVYKVALVGPAGSGKSTHAQRLRKDYGGDVLSFAAPMKKILRDLFGDRMEDAAFAREAAQKFGTDFARKLDTDVWVRQLTKKVPTSRSVFVDDCRFRNEYQALRDLGFVFVRLVASPEELTKRRPNMTAAQHRHESELEQALFHADLFVSTDPHPVKVPVPEDEVVEGVDLFTVRPETEEESIERAHARIMRFLTEENAEAAATA